MSFAKCERKEITLLLRLRFLSDRPKKKKGACPLSFFAFRWVEELQSKRQENEKGARNCDENADSKEEAKFGRFGSHRRDYFSVSESMQASDRVEHAFLRKRRNSGVSAGREQKNFAPRKTRNANWVQRHAGGRSEGIRTPDILLPKQARYQLRYTPKYCPRSPYT